jgi:hypothetical protein
VHHKSPSTGIVIPHSLIYAISSEMACCDS